MTELKWSNQYNENDTIFIKHDSDILYNINKNCAMILPEDMKMYHVINLYIKTNNFYIEYLHWDNNGILDGFIDHNRNMYILNNDYDKRKILCNKLYEKYRIHDFIWCNQTYTRLAQILYNVLNGYLEKSNYNIHTRKILDEYYPRALQSCKILNENEEYPDDMINVDISAKSYPNILLHNISSNSDLYYS